MSNRVFIEDLEAIKISDLARMVYTVVLLDNSSINEVKYREPAIYVF